MIIDAMVFYNEYDMLESRMQYLNDIVDLFVIVESNYTFSGHAKQLNFARNRERFKEYQHKILEFPFIVDADIKILARNKQEPFYLEALQRDHITNITKLLRDDDLILISDVDEIPRKEVIHFLRNNLQLGVSEAMILDQEFYYFDLTQRSMSDWSGPAACLSRVLKKLGAQWFRDRRCDRGIIPAVNRAGWHLSYFLTAQDISKKIKNFSHQEFNSEQYTNPELIKNRIAKRQDLFDRSQIQIGFYDQHDLSKFPADFLTCFAKFIRHELRES